MGSIMGFILQEITLTGTRKTKRLPALLDSGAFRNYVRRVFDDGETVDDVGFHVYEGPHNAVLATGTQAQGERVQFRELRIGERRLENVRFVVMPEKVQGRDASPLPCTEAARSRPILKELRRGSPRRQALPRLAGPARLHLPGDERTQQHPRAGALVHGR